MRIVSVVAARSNIIQLAPVARALTASQDAEHVIIHTGRHDTPGMAAAIAELELPPVQHHLEVGAGPDGVQTGLMLQRLWPALAELAPDVVLAYGDDNAAAAAALAAAKLGIRVGHVEAGLRCGDATMPAEINRVVTDRLASLLFVPSRDAIGALKAEGVTEERIQFVGSLRIDALCWALPRARALDPAGGRGLTPGGYAVASLHEPAAEVILALAELGGRLPVVTAPTGYVELLGLVASAALVVTDAGELQEETSFLGVPCLTVRPKTAHPATCLHGTNRLVQADRATILAAANRALARRTPARPVLERWDGRAAERIAGVLCDGADFPSEPAPLAVPASSRGRRAVAIPQMA